jgi:hypothetical protein
MNKLDKAMNFAKALSALAESVSCIGKASISASSTLRQVRIITSLRSASGKQRSWAVREMNRATS